MMATSPLFDTMVTRLSDFKVQHQLHLFFIFSSLHPTYGVFILYATYRIISSCFMHSSLFLTRNTHAGMWEERGAGAMSDAIALWILWMATDIAMSDDIVL